MKEIITSEFHTSKVIHNHSGKTADLSTVLKSTQPHNLTISAQWLFKTQMVLPAAFLLQHLPAVGTLLQPALENPKYNTSFYTKEKKYKNKQCVPFSEAVL